MLQVFLARWDWRDLPDSASPYGFSPDSSWAIACGSEAWASFCGRVISTPSPWLQTWKTSPAMQHGLMMGFGHIPFWASCTKIWKKWVSTWLYSSWVSPSLLPPNVVLAFSSLAEAMTRTSWRAFVRPTDFAYGKLACLLLILLLPII